MGDLDEIKLRQREMWTMGDFAAIARLIERPSAEVVERTAVESGQDVLDVATGTGNAAMIAAARGATVTGLDITPKLLEIATERASEADLELKLIEGDAENLPFDAGSFDRVLSVFGVMFAPHQQRAAAELHRVCRAGGRIGVCAWTPAGLNGLMFRQLAGHMPPPPAGFQPPVLWGVEDRIVELFAGSGAEFEFEPLATRFEAESAEAWVAYNERVLGPMVMAKQALEPSGGWEAARAELVDLYEEANLNSDGTMAVEADYLLSVVHLPA